MRTGRSLTVCWSLLSGGMSAPEGCLLPGGVCSRGVSDLGVSAPRGVSAPEGVCSGGFLLLGGLLPGGVCSQGVSAPGGGGIPACTEADNPPVDRITDTSKNITLARTSLRPVINHIGMKAGTLEVITRWPWILFCECINQFSRGKGKPNVF